jgi:N-acetyl-gamma-glutamyl-phosphate reductase
MKIRVAILGASGYTGFELIRLLLRHPQVEITLLTTSRDGSPAIESVHPQLLGRLDLKLENASASRIAEQADCVFGCLPHAASAAVMADLLKHHLRVIDLSADYRLADRQIYEQWYGVTHPDADRLGKVPYGLPEFYRDAIRGAQLVANPGCYPTSAILALGPLLKEGLVSRQGIVVDSKSGVSGAGRVPKPAFHFPECNESFAAYGVGTHRHMPEIDQVLSDLSGDAVEVVFTPHLVPMDRGILTTCYAEPDRQLSTEVLLETLRTYYAQEPFVHVTDDLPATKHVAGTNRCHLTARLVRGKVVVVSVIDNLIKGASGAAVQNFNLLYEFDETTALE